MAWQENGMGAAWERHGLMYFINDFKMVPIAPIIMMMIIIIIIITAIQM
jgi:hypothetical protein